MVQLEDVSVKCPKEVNDVRKAVVGIVSDIKAGKSLVEIAGGNLKALSDAIEGVEKIGDEVREAPAETVACLGLLAGELVGVLVAPKKDPA